MQQMKIFCRTGQSSMCIGCLGRFHHFSAGIKTKTLQTTNHKKKSYEPFAPSFATVGAPTRQRSAGLADLACAVARPWLHRHVAGLMGISHLPRGAFWRLLFQTMVKFHLRRCIVCHFVLVSKALGILAAPEPDGIPGPTAVWQRVARWGR